MFIADYMTSEVITISPDMSVSQARKLLDNHHFRHLPVVDEQKRLIGMVSDRDLRSAYPSSILDDERRREAMGLVDTAMVRDIMSHPCSCLGKDATLDDALMVFDRDKVGALPVVADDDVVVGMFSIRDLTAAYKRLFGAAEKGSALIAILDDSKSTKSMSRVAALMDENAIQCTRIIRINYEGGFPRIYLRVNTGNVERVHTLLQDSGFSLLHP
jgi:acetoin utilization protein AcuB